MNKGPMTIGLQRLSDRSLVSMRGGWFVTLQKRRLCTDRFFEAICDLVLQPTRSKADDEERYSRSNGSDVLT